MMKPESLPVFIGGDDDKSNKDSHSNFKVKILGIDISHLSKTIQFIIISSGVLIVFVFYGYILVGINVKILQAHKQQHS